MRLFRPKRCKICKDRRGYRFCVRTGKDVCWHCCNEKRIDLKCPETCKYNLSKEAEFKYKTNADSRTEYTDLIKNIIDFWLSNPQDLFDGKIPLDMLENEQERTKLYDYFRKIKFPALFPTAYLQKRLKLEDEFKQADEVTSPEQTAKQFLDTIIEQDWLNSTKFLIKNSQYQFNDYFVNYKKRMVNNKLINKMTEYDLISSALSKDKKKALVFFEINYKYDLTLNLEYENKKWQITQKVHGKPELVNGENNAKKQVAQLISKQDLGNCYKLLKKYAKIFIDSADFYYYWALYYLLSKDKKSARHNLFSAIEIDPDFIEAKYNYAFLLHTENNIELAIKYYQEILAAGIEDAKTLNNLATIYIDKGRTKEAKELLERCLAVKPDFEMAKKNLERLETD